MSRVAGKNPRDVILRPVVSEKSYGLIDHNVYTFVVEPAATKPEIRDAIEDIFDVRVLSVNTLNRKGKTRRNRRNMGRGKKADTKRALVTLHPDDTIELFEV
jgi:large subunit ribosomal protein L23